MLRPIYTQEELMLEFNNRTYINRSELTKIYVLNPEDRRKMFKYSDLIFIFDTRDECVIATERAIKERYSTFNWIFLYLKSLLKKKIKMKDNDLIAEVVAEWDFIDVTVCKKHWLELLRSGT